LIHSDFQCEFYFIRHGESVSNATPGFVAGVNFDAPLTEKGLEQARLVGRRLAKDGVRFDRVYSSTLVRAIQTAGTILEEMGQSGRPFSRVEALMEQQMPGWRGMPVEEVFTPETRTYMEAKGMDFVPPRGESLRVVQRRVSSWIEDEFINNQELVGTEASLTVAVVGHGTATGCLFHYIMGFDQRFIVRIGMDNCNISRFRFDRDGWSVICINDSSHLGGNGKADVPETDALK
jgi:broad specificity phosphatase PhoE